MRDQHRNAVANGVALSALRAANSSAVFFAPQLPMAGGTDEKLKHRRTEGMRRMRGTCHKGTKSKHSSCESNQGTDRIRSLLFRKHFCAIEAEA